jgi:speckle-type POZ protein
MEQTLRGPIEPFAEGSCELNANIAGLSLSNSLTDVSLVGSNGEALSAHKLILCARSPVFKAMFSNGMKESLSEVVTIPDFDTAVLRDMLVYVYTDRCPQETLEMHAEPLLAAACKYQLKGLESICAVYLSTVITVENAAKIFHLSDALHSEQLKSFSEKFLRDQHLAP